MDINTTKIIKSTNVKKKEVSCFNEAEEDTSCCTTINNIRFISSNSDIVGDDILKVEEYAKPLDFNVDILDHSLDNSMVLKRNYNVNDNNSIQQRNIFYTQQLKHCIEMIKSHNKSHIHVSKHEGSQEYQNSENKIKFSNASEMKKADSFTDITTKTDIKISSLPQNNQTQKQNLQTHKVKTNIVEIKVENSLRKEINDCSTANMNIEVESHLSTSCESKETSQRDLKPLEYSCATCGKRWKTSAELKSHIKTHSTLRPYMCEKCGQAYKHKHALEVHVGMHNGINPFQCSYCKKCFTQKGALMRHLPIHTGETPYQCELCGKRFVHHTSYNMHTLSHSGKKSYQCKVCDTFLLSTSHLKRHMRVHTGEKPYSCNLCGKRFAERYNLFAHRKIHDSDEITMQKKKKTERKCKQCDLVFSKKEELYLHSKCHSNSDENDEKKLIDCIFNINTNTAEISDSHTLHTQVINTKDTNLLGNANEQTWMQSDSHVRLYNINDPTKLVLLENSLLQFDPSSLVIFNNQNLLIQQINHDINSHVVSNITDLNR